MIREAASIILLRRKGEALLAGAATSAGASHPASASRPQPASQTGLGFEVFFVRRHRGSSFMASAYVFPGGAAEPGEDARTAAARELFEEAGVLLAKQAERRDSDTLVRSSQAELRKRILGGVPAADALELAGLEWSTDSLVPWSHWITPSVEPKRFSARFFIVELPPGQDPQFDETETVDQTWVTPQDGLARSAELQLPPPQVRTLWELSQHATIRDVLAAGRARSEEPHPIMPRLAPGASPCLLLPWDPEYVTRGTGEGTPLTYVPRWATGPSRFVLDGKAWRHVEAPRPG